MDYFVSSEATGEMAQFHPELIISYDVAPTSGESGLPVPANTPGPAAMPISSSTPIPDGIVTSVATPTNNSYDMFTSTPFEQGATGFSENPIPPSADQTTSDLTDTLSNIGAGFGFAGDTGYSEPLGVAGPALSLGSGVIAFADNPYDISAQANLLGTVSELGLDQMGVPGAGAIGAVASDVYGATANLYQGNYLSAAEYVAQGTTIAALAAIGAILNPEQPGVGADLGADAGVALTNAANIAGAIIGSNVPDWLLSS